MLNSTAQVRGLLPTQGARRSRAQPAPAILLGNGKALVAGGYACDSSGNCASLKSAEIYDPVAGTFSGAGNMTTDRHEHTMTLLNSGQVLIAGGESCPSARSCTALNTAEIYDAVAGTFTATGSLNAARYNASAVLLTSGQVLIAGDMTVSIIPQLANYMIQLRIRSPRQEASTLREPRLRRLS